MSRSIPLSLLLALACSSPESAPPNSAATEAGPLVVYAVNDPLAYFARRIGGDTVEVHFPAPADIDPADWSPTPEVIAGYQAADLVLLSGAGYASWLSRASLRQGRLLDTGASFADRLIARDGAVTHSHGPQGSHSHAETAYTVWLDPQLASEQARAIAAAFARERPAGAAHFESGLDSLLADLESLDADFSAAASALAGRPLVFSHPVYAYLERRYGLEGRSLHWEAGEAPSAREWRELEVLLRAHPARIFVWEGEPAAETASRLESLGLTNLVFEPGGDAARSRDWLARMRANAAALKSVATAAKHPTRRKKPLR